MVELRGGLVAAVAPCRPQSGSGLTRIPNTPKSKASASSCCGWIGGPNIPKMHSLNEFRYLDNRIQLLMQNAAKKRLTLTEFREKVGTESLSLHWFAQSTQTHPNHNRTRLFWKRCTKETRRLTSVSSLGWDRKANCFPQA